MQGTEKQIAWANQIKDKMIRSFSYLSISKDPNDEEFKQYYDLIIQVDSAKFWIEAQVHMRDDMGLKFLSKRIQNYL